MTPNATPPLRVLHLEAGRQILGGARQVVQLVTGLAQAGVENLVVCPRGSRLIEAVNGVATRILPVPMRGDLDLTTAWHTIRIAARERPDIVHVHSRRAVQWLGGLAARWRHLPVVYSRRCDDPEFALVARPKYAMYDRVIAISSCIHEQLASVGVPPSKLRLVHSGVDPAPADCADRAALCRQFDLAADAFILASIGVFIQRKGHPLILEALSILRERYPQVRLILFGSGPLDAELRSQAAELNLVETVRFAGFRPDVRRWLPGLDLVVHPALAEGLGVALLEAAAAGVPIVAARSGGIPDLVKHEQTGLLVEPGNVFALAAAIARMIDDPALRKRSSAAAFELVEHQFTRDRMAQGNLAIYREVLAERVARAA